MSQEYSDLKRAPDPYALPDVEVFYADHADGWDGDEGWYYWSCFPGCLPDSEPWGPFATRAEALADMRESWHDDDDDDDD